MTIVQLPLQSTVMRFLRDFKETHLLLHPCYFGPSSVCLSAKIGLLMMPSSQVLHSSLTHIDSKKCNYVRLLFIDYSSAFQYYSPPPSWLLTLRPRPKHFTFCDWIQDFLTARPQVVKVGQFTPPQLNHPEHRSPTGLCPEPPAILSIHPTTACPLTAPHLSLNLLMILWSWASLTTMTRPHTWMRWRDLQHGAEDTVSL